MSAEEITARIVQLEVDSSVTKTEIIDLLRQVGEQKQAMVDEVALNFADVRNRIDSLINDTRRELEGLSNQTRDLNQRTKTAVDTLDGRLTEVERKGGGGHGGTEGGVDKPKSYLPIKSTIPEPLGDEPLKWRAWKRDTLGYLDSITRHMKRFLTAVEAHNGDFNREFLDTNHGEFGEFVKTGQRGSLASLARRD